MVGKVLGTSATITMCTATMDASVAMAKKWTKRAPS
jgi:hypothetical protein